MNFESGLEDHFCFTGILCCFPNPRYSSQAAFCWTETPNKGTVRACADDIGAALKDISALRNIQPIFECAEAVAGLRLKPSQCVIVPTRVKFALQVIENIRLWLHAHVTKWSNFQIKPCSKYLGFLLGPAAKSKQLVAPVLKWKKSADEIAQCNLAQAATAILYNRCSITVMGYHAQLIIFDRDVLKHEPAIISKLTHAPHNMLGADLPFQLKDIGCIDFTSLKCLNYAALYRATKKTLVGWEALAEELFEAAYNFLPSVQVFAGA